MSRRRKPKFKLVFAPEVLEHLDFIERKHHRLIQRNIDEQLGHLPEKETRNRKPLAQPTPFEATWELRCGPGNRFRVFYEVESKEKVVWVLAIGVKEGNRLFIGGEEIEL
jgi:mRNA-degrading endonuclease RelE of RelBE toxin-antitoxin system